MSSYIGYMGTNDLIAGDISVSSITADEATVVGDIHVGGLVDGVDIKALGQTVTEHTAELKDHEGRINHLEGKDFTGYMTLDTDQTVSGKKTFIEDIAMAEGKTVDGVDVSVLGIKVANHDTRIVALESDVDSLDTRVTAIEPEVIDHDTRIVTIESEVDGLDTRVVALESKDYSSVVNLSTAQTVGGVKTFTDGIISKGLLTTHSNGVVVNPLAPERQGSVRMGVGISGGANDSDLILAGSKTSVMFNNHYFYEAKNMNYDITCGSDKKLKFNRGTAFPTASEMITLDGASNLVEVKADRLMVSKNNGQVTSGIGLRTANRAQQFLMSNGDNVSEVYFGSDVAGTGIADANLKWAISSRAAADGTLVFYRAPFYTGGAFDSVMDFKNTLTEGKYSCVINLNKPTNIKSETNIIGNTSITGNLSVSGNIGTFETEAYYSWQGPWNPLPIGYEGPLYISKVGRQVTISHPGMKFAYDVTTFNQTVMYSQRTLLAVYRPMHTVNGVARVTTDGKTFMTRLEVNASGVVYIHRTMDTPAVPVYFTGNTRVLDFCISYITN